MVIVMSLKGKYRGQMTGSRGTQHRTTPNVLRAKVRKKESRQQRDQAFEAEARRLHLTVAELLSQKAREVKVIAANQHHYVASFARQNRGHRGGW